MNQHLLGKQPIDPHSHMQMQHAMPPGHGLHHFSHHPMHLPMHVDPAADEQNRRWDPRDEMQHRMGSISKRPRMMHPHDMLHASGYDGLQGVALGSGARAQQPGLQTLAAVAADGEWCPIPSAQTRSLRKLLCVRLHSGSMLSSSRIAFSPAPRFARIMEGLTSTLCMRACDRTAGKKKPQRGPDGKFKPKMKLQERPREHGRFVSASGISHLDLTEPMIRPVMRYCRVTAAEMLKVSTYQLSMACSRLGLKWPRFPQEPTPEHHKALNRKKKKERIPKNAGAFYYGEREEEGVVRFFELRLSSDNRAVYTRWGRPGISNNYAWRANKKQRFATREEAVGFCQNSKAEHRPQDGWIEKVAPMLPNAKPKSKRKAMQGVQSKRKQFREQNQKVKEMMAANTVKADSHSQEEIEAATKKLESMRTKMHRAVRQAKGLVEATKAQRKKVTEMKAANAERPGTHSEEQIKAEMHTLRELMSKYTKRTLLPPKDMRKRDDATDARPALIENPDPKRLRPELGPPMNAPLPPWPPHYPTSGSRPEANPPTPTAHVWCNGDCVRLRKPWCCCVNVAPVVTAASGPGSGQAPSQPASGKAWQYDQAKTTASWPRGMGPGGVYFAGWPFGPMRLRALSDEEALTWPQLCLPDGTKFPPAAVGVRADPSGGVVGSKTVSTPLYFARELFDLIVEPSLTPNAKRKKWERLWKTTAGRDGPLAEYALWIEGGTSPGGLVKGTTRSDALVNFNGIVLIIEAAGDDAARQWLREGAFFEHCVRERPSCEDGGLGLHASSLPAVPGGAAACGGEGGNPLRQAMGLLLQASEQMGALNLKIAIARHLDELQVPSRGYCVPPPRPPECSGEQ